MPELPRFYLERSRLLRRRAVKFDGLFLDMYGTLTTGDRAAVEAACEHVIRETGAPLSAYELSVTWGERFFHALDSALAENFRTLTQLEEDTLVETMAQLGLRVEPQRFVQRLVDYWRNPPLQPDARAFLAAVRAPICIVSNADQDDLRHALRRCEIEVAGVVTSEEVRSYKPDRRIFDVALQRMGWDRACVLHAGDSLHSDVGGAMAAGLRSGWINRAHRIHDVGTHVPDYEFADLMELAGFLAR